MEEIPFEKSIAARILAFRTMPPEKRESVLDRIDAIISDNTHGCARAEERTQLNYYARVITANVLSKALGMTTREIAARCHKDGDTYDTARQRIDRYKRDFKKMFRYDGYFFSVYMSAYCALYRDSVIGYLFDPRMSSTNADYRTKGINEKIRRLKYQEVADFVKRLKEHSTIQ